ncbi:E3 ubiquitin-protein ligase rnf213-alpha-like [Salvelinus alpinus]
MKCTGCGHVAFEKTARFCSQCGHQLSAQPVTKEPDNTLESVNEKTEMESDVSTLNNRETNTSPKRPNEEPNSNPKKKRKKRKRTKKKKDGSPASLDSDQLTSDLSDISLMGSHANNRKQEVAESSDSDASTMDETPNSLHDMSALVEKPASASASSAAPSTVSPSGNTSDNQDPPSTASSQPEASAESQPAAGKYQQSSEEKDLSQSPTKQTSKSAPNDTPAYLTDSAGKSTTTIPLQSASVVSAKTTDQKAPKAADAKTTDQEAPKAADAKTADQEPPKAADAKTADQEAPKAADAKTADQEAPKTADAKTADQKAPKAADAKSTKNKKDVANSKQTNLDQNANVNQNAKQNQTRQDKQKGTDDQQNQDSKQTTAGNKMVLGSQKKSEVESKGSSVDPQVKVENMEVQQQPSHGGGDSSSPTPQTPGVKKEKQKDNKSDDSESKGQDVPPPKRIPPGKKQVSASERLTIYFHAVLSKDFKLNPDEDRIFIRAGGNIGNWDTNSVELTVSKNLGEHGFLVEGSLTTTKSNATVSIPYKYLVYKHKKQKYEFEYIYKLDSTYPTTNRCLFVKSHLLNEEGDWHQYDDIICVEPSKNVLKRLKDALWPEQRKSVIEGREIAGKIMLESIFDLLRSWTDINLKSFLSQLNQFYQIYGNPSVYEETHKKWCSLDYDEKDVRKLLKQFMLDNVVPQLQKEGEGKSCFIQDPMRAAVVMLYVWKQYGLKLDHGESTRLCTALCLPKLPKDSFLQYWTDFAQAVSGPQKFETDLPDMLVALINSVKTEGPRWILVLPLLHLLKGSSKPFTPISTTVTTKYEQSWAGLQGLKAGNMALNSQERRAMLNLMKNNGHLVEMDRLVSRSWMCLLTIEDLMECSVIINVELLDLLHVFTLRAPQDVTYSNKQYVSDTLSHIQSNLIEEKYSCFSESYGRDCLATAVKLLEKICKGVRSTSTYTQNFKDIPVACMNMVVSVSEFARAFEKQATKDVEREHMHAKELDLLSEAMVIVRSWIGKTFRERLLARGMTTLYLSVNVTTEIEIEMWNNIISLKFPNDDFTKEWRQMFTRDLEGKLKQESPLDQIEIYCSKIEVLNESHPHVAKSIEKCALEAVTSLCQTSDIYRDGIELQMSDLHGDGIELQMSDLHGDGIELQMSDLHGDGIELQMSDLHGDGIELQMSDLHGDGIELQMSDLHGDGIELQMSDLHGDGIELQMSDLHGDGIELQMSDLHGDGIELQMSDLHGDGIELQMSDLYGDGIHQHDQLTLYLERLSSLNQLREIESKSVCVCVYVYTPLERHSH